jgi:peptidyl-prolyl cis-trans isomerase SurA
MVRLALVLLLAVAPLGAGNAALAQQRSAFDIALTVNDVPITWYDVDQRMRLLRFRGAPDSDSLQGIAIEQLVEDSLKRGAAERLGIRPTAQAEAELVEVFARNIGRSVDSIERDLARIGATRTTMLEALKADAVWREVVRSRFGSRAEPTEADIDQAIALAAAGQNREFNLSELVIPVAARGEAGTRRFAEELRAELDAGGNFAAAARRHSASPSARAGGAVGWVNEGALPPAIVTALESIRTGGVTQPLTVPGAVVLLKLEDQRLVQIEGAGQLNIGIVALSTLDRDPITAIARVDGVIARNPTCDTAESLAEGSGVTVARATPRPVATLPEQVRNAVLDLQPGAISAPVTVQGGAAAFIVCEREEGVSGAARDALRNQLRQDRFVRFSNSYLQELRADAVIERR